MISCNSADEPEVYTPKPETYIKTFGNESDPAILFLHGGPDYNSAMFEHGAAEEISKSGFFVISYDRNGEGYSKDVKSDFTFQEAGTTIRSIMDKFNIDKVNLIGHSFGGLLAIDFAEYNSDLVTSIILTGAPISIQSSIKSIIKRCEDIYSEKKDTVNLDYIAQFEQMDTTSFQYCSYALMHALSNNFYNTLTPNENAITINSLLASDSNYLKHIKVKTASAAYGYWKNEHYTTLDLSDQIQKIKREGVEVYGIYGKDDLLYSSSDRLYVEQNLGSRNYLCLDSCSHNAFIDRREAFINALKDWIL